MVRRHGNHAPLLAGKGPSMSGQRDKSPSDNGKVPFQVRLDEASHEKLKRLARQYRRSMNKQLLQLISEAKELNEGEDYEH